MKAIQKDPAHRFQTGGEFRDVLIDAGFAGDGMMHGVTGSFRKSPTHPSRPPISLGGPVSSETAKTLISDTGLGGPAVATAAAAIKETRLGQAATAPAAASSMQPTRLVSSSPEMAEQSAAPPASFFSKLSAVHYAGAGAVLLLLIGVVIAIPVFLFSGGSAAANANTKGDNSKRPGVITLQQQPSQNESQTATQPSTTSNSSQTAQPGDLTPVDTSPKADKPAGKTDKPSTVAQKPSTPKSQPPQQAPPPKPAETPKKKGILSRAKDLLTGH